MGVVISDDMVLQQSPSRPALRLTVNAMRQVGVTSRLIEEINVTVRSMDEITVKARWRRANDLQQQEVTQNVN